MHPRLHPVVQRLTGYWRWWRVLVVAVSVAAAVAAVLVDSAALGAVLVVLAFLPVLALFGLTGSRTDDHHRTLTTMRRDLARLAATAEQVVEAAAEAERSARAALAVASLPQLGDLTVVLVATDDIARVDALLEGLAGPLRATVECLVVDRSGDEAVGQLAVAHASSWPGLALVGPAGTGGAGPGQDLRDAVMLAAGRYVLVLDEAIGADDLGDCLALCHDVPAASEPWVGLRHDPDRRDLALVRAAVWSEVPDLAVPVYVDAELCEQLEEQGFTVDSGRAPRRAIAPGRRAYRPRARPVSVSRRDHELVGTVALLPQLRHHADDLVPVAMHLERSGPRVAWLVRGRWADRFGQLLHRTTAEVFALPPAGAWLDGVGGLVTAYDEDQVGAEVVEAANRYGVPTFALVAGLVSGPGHGPAARHLLCRGQADLAALAGSPGRCHVVGSSRLERLWAEPPRAVPEQPAALIDAGEGLDADELIRVAAAACGRAGIDVVADPAGAPDSALRRASIVIAAQGFDPLPAMAVGVPVVQLRLGDGPGSDGYSDAVDRAAGAHELDEAIDRAMSWAATYRTRCEDVFRAHVDIEPERPAAQRMAEVILSVLGSA